MVAHLCHLLPAETGFGWFVIGLSQIQHAQCTAKLDDDEFRAVGGKRHIATNFRLKRLCARLSLEQPLLLFDIPDNDIAVWLTYCKVVPVRTEVPALYACIAVNVHVAFT